MQGRRHAPQVVRQGHGHYLPPAQLHAGLPGHQQQQQQHGQHEQHHGHGHGHHGQPHHQAAVAAPAPGAARHLTSTTFASLPLSPSSQRALAEVLRFTHLTEVQNATLPAVLAGGDVMARAKTGTGKTMAFLIPAIEALVRAPPRQGDGISVLVLSPTRELASQIEKEAEQLLRFHPFKAQVVYGGTNINSERNRLGGRCDVLVATPGRLIDHLENSGLAQKLQRIRTLVLDEADQLLEMGFRPAIERVLSFLPRDRQTLLFSATMPQAVQQVAGLALKQQHSFIDTIGEEDSATNVQVEQSYALIPMEQQFAAIYNVLRRHAEETPDHKVIVFFTTARLTQYMAALIDAAGLPVLEIHSRKSQSAREKASAQFRTARSAIMFSSDVSARGVDYPDVTLVLQIGIPSSREQYIHRLGRTARAGRTGRGVLLLMPEEQHFLRQLRDLPLAAEPGLPITQQDNAAVQTALSRVIRDNERLPEMAYAAWLGFYNSAKGMGWDKPTLVQQANRFASVMGLAEPPALLKKTIGMMGLKGVPGLRIDSGGGFGGGRGGGGGRQQQGGQQQAQQQQQRQAPVPRAPSNGSFANGGGPSEGQGQGGSGGRSNRRRRGGGGGRGGGGRGSGMGRGGGGGPPPGFY